MTEFSEKKIIEHKTVLSFPLQMLYETFHILRILQLHIKNVYRSSRNYMLFLSDFNQTGLF
jgi:hypothetical protein